MTETKQYCSFHVAGLFFGIEVQRVQEVIRYQPMSPVPLAPPEIGGLINLRGQIVTAIDLRQRLGLPALAEGKLPMNVIVRTEDAAVSLLVDEIGDVLQCEPDSYEPPPETLSGVTRDLVRGVHKLDGRLLLVLDTTRATGLAAAA